MRDDPRQLGGHQGSYVFAHPSQQQQQPHRESTSSSRAGAGHPHSLGSLLNHPAPLPNSRSHSPTSTHSQPRESPRSNTKSLHLSPAIRSAPSHVPSSYTHTRINGHGSSTSSSPHSAPSIIDVDKEYPYEDDKQRSSPPIATLEQEARDRARQRQREG